MSAALPRASPSLVFGPVPSRRLGRSLGINNIPPKVCSYSCVYCQVGRTLELSVARRPFHGSAPVVEAVAARLEQARKAGEAVDHLTLVPDGEPTLDRDLGATLYGLAQLGPPVAVITNGSLLWQAELRAELARAAWVSVKVDAVDETLWRQVNRPARALRLAAVLDGLRAFAHDYTGTLATETMLVGGVNDRPEHLAAVADFLGELQPAEAWISAPTRPPAEGRVKLPAPERLALAHALFAERVEAVGLLVESEPETFASLGPVGQDLVATCAVHPMRRPAAEALLASHGASPELLEELVGQGLLAVARHRDEDFIIAGWQRRSAGS